MGAAVLVCCAGWAPGVAAAASDGGASAPRSEAATGPLVLPAVVVVPSWTEAGGGGGGGRRVLIPVGLRDGAQWSELARPGAARLRVLRPAGREGADAAAGPGGEAVDGELWLLAPATALPRFGGALAGWLGGADELEAQRVGAAGPGEDAAPWREAAARRRGGVLVLAVPAQAMAGVTGVELGTASAPVIELSAADERRGLAIWAAAADSVVGGVGAKGAGAPAADVSALVAAARGAADGWRARLVLSALGADAGPPPESGVLADTAEQARRVWAGAVGRLAGADAGLAARVAERMLACVRVPLGGAGPADGGQGGAGAAVVPCWPIDAGGGGPAELVSALTVTARADRAADAARAWLDRQPAVLAAVVDDGPRRLGLLNLMGTAQEVRVDGRAAGASVPARAWSVIELPAGAELVGLGALQAAAEPGRTRVDVAGVGARRDVRPPGLKLGPLQPVLTLADLYGAPPPPSGAPGSAKATGWLYRDAPPGAAANEGWRLLVECARPSGPNGAGGEPARDGRQDTPRDEVRDEVRVILGREPGNAGAPRLVLTVNALGEVRSSASGGRVVQRSPVWVRPAGGGSGGAGGAGGGGDARGETWSVVVQLPPEAVETLPRALGPGQAGQAGHADAGGSVLWLGIVRLLDGQPAAAWPRGPVPWVPEPGVGGLRLDRWDFEPER